MADPVVFLDTLSNLAYKAIKKNGEFVLPGFDKLVKQKRKARIGFNPNGFRISLESVTADERFRP